MQAGFKKKQLFIRQSHKFIPSTLAQASSWFALRKPTRCVRYAPHHQPPSQDTKQPPSGGISSDPPGGMIVRKVAVKSRRRRRSVRLYSTEPMSDDLTRDCARGPAGKKNAVRRNHLPRQRLPHACRAEKPDNMRNSSDRGALSRRYPVVLSRRSRGSELAFSTEVESADKASGSKRERSVTF